MCEFCENEKVMMQKAVIHPGTVAFCGGITPEAIPDLEYRIGVFIDTRGYLRLVDLEDCQCLDGGEKIKIKFCPICGVQIKQA